MKKRKDLKKRFVPVFRAITRTSVFWNPMEAAILGLDMGANMSDDWFD